MLLNLTHLNRMHRTPAAVRFGTLGRDGRLELSTGRVTPPFVMEAQTISSVGQKWNRDEALLALLKALALALDNPDDLHEQGAQSSLKNNNDTPVAPYIDARDILALLPGMPADKTSDGIYLHQLETILRGFNSFNEPKRVHLDVLDPSVRGRTIRYALSPYGIREAMTRPGAKEFMAAIAPSFENSTNQSAIFKRLKTEMDALKTRQQEAKKVLEQTQKDHAGEQRYLLETLSATCKTLEGALAAETKTLEALCETPNEKPVEAGLSRMRIISLKADLEIAQTRVREKERYLQKLSDEITLRKTAFERSQSIVETMLCDIRSTQAMLEATAINSRTLKMLDKLEQSARMNEAMEATFAAVSTVCETLQAATAHENPVMLAETLNRISATLKTQALEKLSQLEQDGSQSISAEVKLSAVKFAGRQTINLNTPLPKLAPPATPPYPYGESDTAWQTLMNKNYTTASEIKITGMDIFRVLILSALEARRKPMMKLERKRQSRQASVTYNKELGSWLFQKITDIQNQPYQGLGFVAETARSHPGQAPRALGSIIANLWMETLGQKWLNLRLGFSEHRHQVIENQYLGSATIHHNQDRLLQSAPLPLTDIINRTMISVLDMSHTNSQSRREVLMALRTFFEDTGAVASLRRLSDMRERFWNGKQQFTDEEFTVKVSDNFTRQMRRYFESDVQQFIESLVSTQPKELPAQKTDPVHAMPGQSPQPQPATPQTLEEQLASHEKTWQAKKTDAQTQLTQSLEELSTLQQRHDFLKLRLEKLPENQLHHNSITRQIADNQIVIDAQQRMIAVQTRLFEKTCQQVSEALRGIEEQRNRLILARKDETLLALGRQLSDPAALETSQGLSSLEQKVATDHHSLDTHVETRHSVSEKITQTIAGKLRQQA